jgi:O-antigen ligase
MGHFKTRGNADMEKTINFRKMILLVFFSFMVMFRSLYVFKFRGLDCASNWLTPISPCLWLNAILEIVLWGILLILFILELHWDHGFKELFVACCSFWPLFLFVLLAALSLIWSVLFQVTLYKVFTLVSTTIMAIYIGRLLCVQKLLDWLAWFFAAFCVANLIVVIVFPAYGIMAGAFFHQAWNGIFWHKIYLGGFMALAVSVFLLKLLNWKTLTLFSKIMNSAMFLLAAYLLIQSKTVASIFVVVVLIAVSLVVAAWLRWGKSLKRVHYFIVLGILLVAVGLILSHLGLIFSLFGRNTSLTGRVPIWNYLFTHVISQRPILGYGYDAVWNLHGFREQITQAFNLGLQVSQSDNGFIEILLHLGIVGLVMIIGLIVLGLVRSVKYFLQVRTITSALPLVILVFAVLTNLTVSMLLETDSFVWAVVIISQAAIPFGGVRQKNGIAA